MTTITSELSVGTRIAQRLAKAVGPHRFGMWFDHTARLDYHDQDRRLEIAVPNRFIADWIGKHFKGQIEAAARDEVGPDVDFSVHVDPHSFARRALSPAGEEADPRAAAVAEAPRRVHTPYAGWSAAPPVLPRYRLEDFVVGASNELAYAAAVRLVEQDEAGLSPLFLHGGVGLGKTHLLQGVCRRMLELKPQAHMLYTTGEQFTNEFLAAMRANRLEQFRRKIRKLDLLAVDDVHFIANKAATQQEFLHSFNACELAGAKVVLASDCHPKMIQQFSQALVSRCVRGMVVEVKTPDTATRMRIVQALAQRRGIPMLESVVAVIAGKCSGSVRDIEGTLTKLQALALLDLDHRTSPAPGITPGIVPGFSGTELPSSPIGHTLVNRLFQQDTAADLRKPVRMETIITVVAERLGVVREKIVQADRHRPAVLARSVVIHLARQLTGMSYPEIAGALGRSSHSTIIAADQRIQKQIAAATPLLVPNPADASLQQIPMGELLEQLQQAIRRK